jgi:hypothetical protein
MKVPKSFIPDSFEPDPEPESTQSLPPTPPFPDINPKPHFFIDTRIKHTQKQVEYYKTKLLQQDAITETPRRIADNVELEKATHQTLVETQRTNLSSQQAQQKQIEFASSNNMDVPTSNAWRFEQEKAVIDVDKTRKLTKVEISKTKHLERNRLKAYKKEVQIDLNAALGMHMLHIEKIDYLGRKISELRTQTADPDRIAFLEKLRVQMERRLLETDDQENVAGIDPAPES